MNKQFHQLLSKWPLPVIRDEDIYQNFDEGDAQRQSLMRRYVNKGWPIRLKRGLYSLGDSPYEAAQYLYPPSYLSFETALSLHGLIPESIHQISSATYKRNKSYKNPLGTFQFCFIPSKNFFLGVEKKDKILLAKPLKALADIYYAQNRPWQTWGDVCEDLRLDDDNLLFKERELLFNLKNNYPSKRVRQFLKNLNA